jgi:hypothetical protein
VDSSTKRKLSNYWSGPWTVVEKLTDLLYRIAPHNLWRTCVAIPDVIKIQFVGRVGARQATGHCEQG